jgi:capsular polysaccharide export protein
MVARDHGVRCFAYEFGYLRPDWITLEREGMGVLSHFPDDPDLVERLAAEVGDHRPPPQRYPFTFAAEAVNEVTYHLTPVFLPFLYPHYVRDRFYHPLVEYVSYLPKLFRRRRNHRRANAVIRQLVAAGTPYFVVVMQMQGDYQVRRSSPYRSLRDFIDQIIESFGRHAPPGFRLVFKMHPLENGIENWPGVIRARSVAGGCGDRVDVIDGGDLTALLHDCRGVVTLNSTAGLTASIEGVPVKTLGIAVYDMPRVTFQGPLDTFWNEARPPERRTVQALVKLLATTIQVKGNFFTPAGRAAAAEEFTRRLTSGDVHNFGAFVDPPPRLAKARRLGVPGADDALEVE